MGKSKQLRKRTIISCGNYGRSYTDVPLGINWCGRMALQYNNNRIICLLHGNCLEFGLNSESYRKLYRTANPFEKNIKELLDAGVKVKVCKLCWDNAKYPPNGLIPGVKFVDFSIKYIIDMGYQGHQTVYDFNIGALTAPTLGPARSPF